MTVDQCIFTSDYSKLFDPRHIINCFSNGQKIKQNEFFVSATVINLPVLELFAAEEIQTGAQEGFRISIPIFLTICLMAVPRFQEVALRLIFSKLFQ